MTNIEELVIKIQADAKDLDRALKRSKTDLNKLGTTAERSGRKVDTAFKKSTRSLQEFNKQLKYTGLAMAGFSTYLGQNVVRNFAEFDQELKNTISILGLTGDELNEIEKRIKQTAMALSGEMPYSASEAVKAMYELESAGLDVNTSLATLPKTLKLAAAANTEVSNAVKISTGLMAMYKLKLSEMEHAHDVGMETVRKHKTNLDEWGDAMKEVGGVANDYNISLEETSQVMGLLADANINGARAGTMFRRILLNLYTGAGQAGTALEDLGISAYDVEGNYKSFGEVLNNIDYAFKDLSKEEKAHYSAMIAGSEAIAAFTPLMSEGGESIRDATEDMKKLGTVTDDVFNVQMEGAGNKIDIFKNKLGTMKIGAGEQIWQDVMDFSEALAEMNEQLGIAGNKTPEELGKIGGRGIEAGALLGGGALALWAGSFMKSQYSKLGGGVAGLVRKHPLGFMGTAAIATQMKGRESLFQGGLLEGSRFDIILKKKLKEIEATKDLQEATSELHNTLSDGTGILDNYGDAGEGAFKDIDNNAVSIYRTAQAYYEFGGAIDDLKGQLEGLNEEMEKNREEMEEIEEAARRRGEATEEEEAKLDGLTDAEKKLQKQIRNTRREIDSMRIIERQGSKLSEEQKNKLHDLERQYDVLTYQLDDNRYSYEDLSAQIRERGELTDEEENKLRELKSRERDLNDELKDKKRNYDSATDAMENALGKNKTYLEMADDIMKKLQDEGYNVGELAKSYNLLADAKARASISAPRSAPSSGGGGGGDDGGDSGGGDGGSDDGDLNLFPDLPPWVNPPPESEPLPSPIKPGGGSNNPNPRGSVWNPIKMAEGGGPIPYDDFPALLHKGEFVLNTEHLKVLNNVLTQPRLVPSGIEGSIYQNANVDVDTRSLEQSIDKLSNEIEQMKTSPQINNEIRTEISFPNAIIKEEADLERLFSHDVFDRLFDKINREIGNRSSGMKGGWV